MAIETSTELFTKARTEVLYDVVRDFCEAFGCDRAALETIRKGVFERQILEKIFIYYLDYQDRALCEIILTIDWEKHKMFTETSTGKNIMIDQEKSMLNQFADWSNDIIEHTRKLRREYNIVKIRTSFRFLPEIRNNQEKDNEAMRFLNLVNCKEVTYSTNAEQFTQGMQKIVSNFLPELKLEIYNK